MEVKRFIEAMEGISKMLDANPLIYRPILDGNRYITEQELSKALKITKRTLIEYRMNGKLPYYKIGGKKLAGIIQKNMIKELDNTNKRVEKPDSAYYMLRNTQVPTVIVECGFLSNREEAYKLNNDEYQQKTAYSIYCGIIEYLGQN